MNGLYCRALQIELRVPDSLGHFPNREDLQLLDLLQGVRHLGTSVYHDGEPLAYPFAYVAAWFWLSNRQRILFLCGR